MKKTIRLVLLPALVASPLLLAAHPMGNFSINHHSKIHVSSGAISITTILDFAEISTFQLFSDPRRASEHAGEWVSGLRFQAAGRRLPLHMRNVQSEIVPAPTGLPIRETGDPSYYTKAEQLFERA